MTQPMDPERERKARAELYQLAERDAARQARRKPRPSILPPGNLSVQAILAIERLINDGVQISVVETEWQRDRRLMLG